MQTYNLRVSMDNPRNDKTQRAESCSLECNGSRDQGI